MPKDVQSRIHHFVLSVVSLLLFCFVNVNFLKQKINCADITLQLVVAFIYISHSHPPPSSIFSSLICSYRTGGGKTGRKILRFVDKIAKSKYFQKATENEFIKKKFEEMSNMPLLLTVEVQELSGALVVNIPPPPTDRIWYELKAEIHFDAHTSKYKRGGVFSIELDHMFYMHVYINPLTHVKLQTTYNKYLHFVRSSVPTYCGCSKSQIKG